MSPYSAAAYNRHKVYKLLCRAADKDRPCPTNNDIAADAGFNSPATSSRIISDLENAGLIEVRREANGRKIRICDTGQTIATRPHSTPSRLPRFRPKAEEIVELRQDAAERRRTYELEMLREEQRRYALPRMSKPLSDMPA
ncbi:helix-turn-helix domain-containing protein [Croceibacterium aestuarii]|uniref:helix-turn-helix domain-containing protein n=1 Tax=Croceibacterium aestuarii TaxID=3064139 RepID=UPI00272DE104|nr:helix-turn-helix domain-containing protein [Croceibacterium sp. D39]